MERAAPPPASSGSNTRPWCTGWLWRVRRRRWTRRPSVAPHGAATVREQARSSRRRRTVGVVPLRAVVPSPGRARSESILRGHAGAAAAAIATVGVVAPPRARGPPIGGGTPMCRGNGTAAIGHGRGLAETMHAGHTFATVGVGESPRSLADRVGVGDGGGALGGREAVGRAACSDALRGRHTER